MKCVPARFVAEQQLNLVLSIILGFHVLIGCDTMLPLPGKGKNTCWKKFIKNAHLLTGVVRYYNADDALAFVCSFYVIGKGMLEVLMMPGEVFFVKVKRNLHVLPPTHGALQLHITRAKAS